MSFIITVVSPKGGSGKTTTSLIVASGLARKKINTALLDFSDWGDIDYYIPDMTTQKYPMDSIYGDYIIVNYYNEYLKILSGHNVGGIMYGYFHPKISPVHAFNALEEIFRFDSAVIDAGHPNTYLGGLSIGLANWILIPMTDELGAIESVVRTVNEIQNRRHCDSNSWYYSIVPIFNKPSSFENNKFYRELLHLFDTNVCEPIPYDTRIRESYKYPKMTMDYHPETEAIAGSVTNGRRYGGYAKIIFKLFGHVIGHLGSEKSVDELSVCSFWDEIRCN